MSKPALTGTTHTLPFDKLSDKEFERMCLWLVEREGYQRVQHYGELGSEQGRDLVAWQVSSGTEQRVVFQCKRVKSFTWSDIEKELIGVDKSKGAKIFDLPEDKRPAVLIFIVASKVSADARDKAVQACNQHGIICDFWASTELDLKVNKYPEIVREFFQVGIIPAALHQLEPPPADFTGREKELEELIKAESSGKSIFSIQGMGGVGKTVLALKLAETLAPRFPDAQLYFNLRGTDPHSLTSADALAHVVRSFLPQEKLPEGEQLKALYRSLLHGKQVLLLMDNARSADQVRDLIPPAGSILLITSRWHFTLPGQFDWDLEQLPPADAQALALAIAPRLGEQAPELAKLCDYLPEALRVSASALRERQDFTPDDYLSQLRDTSKRPELTGVEASLRLSYDLLSDNLKHNWAALSVFPASFEREAVAAVLALETELARQTVSELLAYSLLEFNPESLRYTLHDLSRLVAGKHLGENDKVACLARHAGHYLQVLSTAYDLYLHGGDQMLSGLRLFDLEWENLQSGQAWAASNAAKDKTATQLCMEYPDAATYLLNLRLHPRQNIEWREAGLFAAQEIGNRRGEGNALNNLGLAYAALGDVRKAIDHHQQALAISREIGDRRLEGNYIGNLGIAYYSLGETHQAIDYYQQALAIARDIEDRRGEEVNLGHLGIAYADLKDVQRAIGYFEQALAIAWEINDLHGEGNHLGNLGNSYLILREAQRAIEYYEQALAIAREIKDRRGEGTDLGNLGLAYYSLGEFHNAIDYYEQALVIRKETIDRRGESNDLANLGLAYRELGDKEQASKCWKQALVILTQIESPHVDKVRGWLEELDNEEGEKRRV